MLDYSSNTDLQVTVSYDLVPLKLDALSADFSTGLVSILDDPMIDDMIGLWLGQPSGVRYSTSGISRLLLIKIVNRLTLETTNLKPKKMPHPESVT
jgi:hypothetical protein